MTPNYPRIREALLLVLNDAERRGHTVTQYDIVKTVFLADRAHLNKYGRPITFDNYVAMEHGPVPSAVYNALKHEPYEIKKIGGLFWTKTEAPEIGDKCFRFHEPRRNPDFDIVSESDAEELSSALTTIKSLTFKQIRRLTHEDAAYLDAWEDDHERHQFPMSYALLFEEVNDDMAAQVSFASEVIAHVRSIMPG